VRHDRNFTKNPEGAPHSEEDRPNLAGTSTLEPARPLTEPETRGEDAAVDQIDWQIQQGAQTVQRWLWTAAIFALALALLVVGFFAPSP
jgi:hypothetical protein